MTDITANMFESIFGVSRTTFLNKHVVPAKSDDKFYNDKCIFCFGKYEQFEHPAVRILPCGHIFGRDCVVEMTKGATGDLCPLCRTSLFRRPMSQKVLQYMEEFLTFLSSLVTFCVFVGLLSWCLYDLHGAIVQGHTTFSSRIGLFSYQQFDFRGKSVLTVVVWLFCWVFSFCTGLPPPPPLADLPQGGCRTVAFLFQVYRLRMG